MNTLTRIPFLRKGRTRCARWSVALLLLALTPSATRAVNPAGDLRVELITAYNLIVDSNVESPATYAPRSAYIGATFYNDGANDLTNLVVFIGNYGGGTNDTPGIYPSRTHPPLVGTFSLTHEGGSSGTADATRYLGTLAAGESITVYWLVSYPNLDDAGDAVWGPSVKPEDDLWLEYDVWGTAVDAGSSITADVTRKVTMRNEISAMANKIIPNTANKVPQEYLDLLSQYVPSWTNAASDGTIGTRITTTGFWYDLGNIGAGFDNDNDLVPDKNAWMQPVGDPSLFDPSAFRLVKTRAMVVVKLKSGGEQVYITEDQLYFENVPENNGAVGLVIYEFVPIKASAEATMSPYQEVASGYDNEKFNGDYGVTIGGLLGSGDSHITLDKTADRGQVWAGSNIAYTVSFANTGTVEVGEPTLGCPLVIQDEIPPGTYYQAGTAYASNVLPVGVSSYTVLFSTNSGTGWLTAEPASAGMVTHIQWWLSDKLVGGASGSVRFVVQVTNTYSGPPLIVNNSGLSFGNMDPFEEDDATTLILGSNSVGDTVFVDDGSGGGIFGNGTQEGTEPGLSNILVRLYYDSNSNGIVEATDLLLTSTNSATSGSYLFSGLPDGPYLAEVNATDSDIPYGYTVTTNTSFAANLDQTGTNGAPVAYLSADWGFAPALLLDKTGGGVIREGTNITYGITVTNRLAGDAGITTYTLWANQYDSTNSGSGNREWLNYSNVFYPTGFPDGLSATAPMANVAETIAAKGMSLGVQFGAITNVELIFQISTNGTFNGGDSAVFHLLEAGVSIYASNLLATAMTNGQLRFNVTSIKAWNWTNFASTNALSGQVVASGGGGGPSYNGVINLDAVGMRIMSDQAPPVSSAPNTTVDPLPLTDYYDAGLLQFVGASITPDSVVTSGVAPNSTGTLYWSNIGPLYAGGAKTITLTFLVLEPMNNTSTTVTNTAFTFGATYGNGRPANTYTDSVVSALLPAGSIGDFVWRDRNGNGIQDGGEEVGIPGVEIRLVPPPGVDIGRGAGAAITNTTDSTGYYLFPGLPADGSYTVTVVTATLPGGSGTNTFDRDGTNNSTTIVLLDFDATNGSDTVTNADWGYQVSSTIRGSVWHDLNWNGATAPDSGEQYLTNVTVYLFNGATGGSPATAIATNRTGTNGFFQFVGNYTGTYSILVWTNSGQMSNTGPWTATFDSDGIIGNTNLVAFGIVGGGYEQVDFSYARSGNFSIGDTLFYDWDGDRVQSATEDGISSIRVYLYEDSNTNGLVDAGQDALIATTNTSTNGTYLFSNLAESNYLVVVDHADSDFPDLFSVTADPYRVNDGRSVVILTTNRLDQDFGYQPYGAAIIGDQVWYDQDGDGVKAGTLEVGISNVTVSLYVDINGDGIYQFLTNTTTSTNGTYAFTNLPNTAYRVIVSTNDTDIPTDALGAPYSLTTPGSYDITITAQVSVLTADFGFMALGAIGDTIFWDANESGSQDVNENGIANVLVSLYVDVNTNGVYDPATDTFFAQDTTDTNGNYFFAALPADDYVVVVSEVGALLGKTCSADPDADGVPFGPGTDGEYGVNIDLGENFMGADFGYVPAGVIGDTVWMDLNSNGVFDTGEVALPYVAVELRSNGVLIATNVTDSDGIYLFSDFVDGIYAAIVLTNDSDFPASLYAVYDRDGTLNDQTANLIVSNGHIVSIEGVPVSPTNDLTIDFGYRFSGTNVLSGTVGLDALPYDGLLGTGPNGVLTNEAAFGSVSVYLYMWTDQNGDTNVDSGETRLIVSTTTSTNGDYSFSDLPSGTASNRYIVSLAAPDPYLRMTTTNGSTPAYRVQETLNASSNTVSAYQIVTIQPVSTNIDFAFRSTVDYDFGDLPQSYLTRFEGAPSGPRHKLRSTPNLYLGTNVDAEVNGQPSVDALGDGADENGVTPLGVWQTGTNGGSLTFTVGAGSGWLVGYIDFGGNGDFFDADDMMISVPASNGVHTNSFAIPITNVISSTNTSYLYARFRLLPSQPLYPEIFFSGYSANGEVEDYRWVFGVVSDFIWKDVDADATYDSAYEPPIAGVRVYIDRNGNGSFETNEPFTVTGTNGLYSIGGVTPGSHVVAVDTSTLPLYVVQTYDLDGTATLHRATATITNGEVRTDVDFAYAGMALGGQVWHDVNTNGLQDEGVLVGLSNVIVRLYDSSTNWIGSAASDTNGLYFFDIATPGNYFVEFFPINYLVSPRDQGTNDTLDSDVSTNAPYQTIQTTINAGERELYWDMGLYRPAQTNTIGDRVWLDADQNGLIDTNEIGVSGITVQLYDAFTNLVRTTLTDVEGFYYFSGLASNNYFVGFVLPANYTFTVLDAGSDVNDSDANITNGYTASFLVTNGFATTNLDAGLIGRLDLGVTKTIDNTDPDPSNIVRYTILVTNNGPLTATGIEYKDIWPSGLSYLSYGATRGSYNSTSTVWSIGTLSNGFTATLTITGQVNGGTAGTTITNTIYLSHLHQSDTNAANNTSTVAVLVRSLDLGVIKSVNNTNPFEGSNVIYTIVITNFGPKNATGVIVSEPMPAGVTYVTNTVSQGSFNGTGLFWTVGSLASNAGATLTLTALVGAGTGGATLTNTATLTGVDQTDTEPTNNYSSVAIIVRGADLGITKSVNNDIPSPGDTIIFTLQVTNYGPNAVTNVRVADPVPVNSTHVTNAPSQGGYSPTSGIWQVGSVAVGGGATLTITLTVTTNTTIQAITNIANITTSSLPDPNLVNNTATSVVRISVLKLTKSASPAGPVDLGSNITYTIVVSNSGGAFQTNVSLSDMVPNGALYVSGSATATVPYTVGSNYVDQFNAIAFTNQDGTARWANAWQELGEADGAAAGNIRIAADGAQVNVARFERAGYGFWRLANTLGSKRAILSFDYRREGLDSTSDVVRVSATSNGGSTWAEIGLIQGVSNTTGYLSTNLDLSAYSATNLGVHFQSFGMGNGDIVYLDNIQIAVESRFYQAAATSGPTLLLTNQVLENAEYAQLTFDVQVQSPPPVDIITNRVTATSFLITNPLVAYATTPLSITDIGVTKDASTNLFVSNQLVRFDIVVTNNGPYTSRGIEMYDAWPTTMTFLAAIPSMGSYSTNNATNHVWTIGTLTSGQGASLVVSGQVTTIDGVLVISNGVQVTSTKSFDRVLSNNRDGVALATVVVLTRIEAFMENGLSVLEWETASEFGTIGFFVSRPNPAGDPIRLHPQLLTAVFGAAQGAVYRCVLPELQPGVDTELLLEEVEASGLVNPYGPFVVRAENEGGELRLDGRDYVNQRRTDSEALFVTGSSGGLQRMGITGGGIAKMSGPGYVVPLTLQVATSGVYYLDAATAAGVMGTSAASVSNLISSGMVSMTHMGSNVAVRLTGGRIYFFGEKTVTPYTTRGVYKLAWSNGLAMTAGTGQSPTPVAGTQEYRHSARFETDSAAVPSVAQAEGEDFWFWDYFSAGSPTEGTRSYTLTLPDMVPGKTNVRVAVTLHGASSASASNDHRVSLWVGGSNHASVAWKGLTQTQLLAWASSDRLATNTNTIVLVSTLDAGVPYSIAYLDSITVDYQRYSLATGGQALINEEGLSVVTAGRFNSTNILVLGLSNSLRPTVVGGLNFNQTGSTYRVSFTQQFTVGRYAIAETTAARLPWSVTVDTPSSLQSSTNGADYLLIGDAAFDGPMQTLAAYRESRGLAAKVIHVDDVFDEFAFGVRVPAAIRSLLIHAVSNWSVPPRYVVLVGEGTYDYRGVSGYADNLVPAEMTLTPLGLTPSDAVLADLDANDTPDLAIGRLPVVTVGELERVVNRIMSYEASVETSWQDDVLLLADDPDSGGDFHDSSDRVARRLPGGYDADMAYLTPGDVTNTRLHAVASLNEGRLLFNYFGHGGVDRLASEGLLTTSDMPLLMNSNRLTIAVSMSCAMGQFAIPGYDCLGEDLLLGTNGGAIAVWAPSGLAYNRYSEELCTLMYDALFETGATVLGDAIREATATYVAGARPGYGYIGHVFNLFGDPALRVADIASTGLRPARSLTEWTHSTYTAAELAAPTISSADADADGDGQSNLMEYLFGRDPRVTQASAFVIPLGSAAGNGAPAFEATYEFIRRKDVGDYQFAFTVSTNLMLGWTASTNGILQTTVTDTGDGVTETVRIHIRRPANAAHIYLKFDILGP